MNARISQLAIAVALALVAILPSACLPEPGNVVPPADLPPVPIAAVTEQQDEWLHDSCTPKKLLSAVSLADADRQIRASEGNFGEVVYETSSMQIVAFACPGKPTWSRSSAIIDDAERAIDDPALTFP